MLQHSTKWCWQLHKYRPLARHFSAHPPPKFGLGELIDRLPDTPAAESTSEDIKTTNDAFSANESAKTEQKEEMIFKEVLSHVLSNPARPKSQARAQQSSSTPLADSILALFEQSKPTSSETAASSTEQQSEWPTTKRTVNLMDGLLNPLPQEQVSPEALKKKEAIDMLLSTITNHITSLQTNRDVASFFKNTVISKFDPKAAVNIDATTPYTLENLVVGPDTVSILLEKCISVLYQDFKDVLGALHLFETAKRHSISLFTEACSAEVYNQIIRIRWYEYRDLYAVVNLAAEIAINAIAPTLETTELLSNIYRDAYDSSKGMSTSQYGMPLWTGQDMRRLEELNRYRTRFQASWAAKPVMRF